MARAAPDRRIRFEAEEGGSLMVLEAILVALLVLTAILFFTSVQRPSTGSDQGGLDLGQVAADTLQILQSRTFSTANGTQTFEDWITNGTRGDTLTAGVVQDFLAQVLPTGARYSLRLDNGVGGLVVLPAGSSSTPHGARASEIMIFPNWAVYRNQTIGDGLTVTPGDVVSASHALVSGTYACYQAPNGFTTGPDGPDAGSQADSWASRWAAAPGPSTPWKSSAAVLGSSQQIPQDLPFGRWKLSTAAAVSGACTAGTITYANVVPPGSRTVTGSVASGAMTVTSGTLAASDIGKTVVGVTGSGSGAARIVAVGSPTTATLSVGAATAAAGSALTISPDSTFLPYGIQLVVWFGA